MKLSWENYYEDSRGNIDKASVIIDKFLAVTSQTIQVNNCMIRNGTIVINSFQECAYCTYLVKIDSFNTPLKSPLSILKEKWNMKKSKMKAGIQRREGWLLFLLWRQKDQDKILKGG